MLAAELEQLTREIRATFQALGRFGNALHEDYNVTTSMRAVMECLNENGAQTVPSIAASKGVSRQHIQVIVNDLIEYDLAEAHDNPNHERSVLIALTRHGTRIFNLMKKREKKLFAKIGGAMSRTNIPLTTRTLRELREIITQQTKQEK